MTIYFRIFNTSGYELLSIFSIELTIFCKNSGSFQLLLVITGFIQFGVYYMVMVIVLLSLKQENFKKVKFWLRFTDSNRNFFLIEIYYYLLSKVGDGPWGNVRFGRISSGKWRI